MKLLEHQAWLWREAEPRQANADVFLPVSNRQISEVAERLRSAPFRVVVLASRNGCLRCSSVTGGACG